ncbi:EAL domain-containing protein [Novosphingobium lentum]|uniref:EAL domain-containing protein n=1 Tax=Novosphingobium lentum TaxID=145287 RepID=UPI001FDF8B2A|nr:EAL domain-containing protein [Novosphingobium lentum]
MDPLDHIYWNTRFKFGAHDEAPQSIVVVTFDGSATSGNGSLRSTADQARLLEAIKRQVPSRVILDTRIRAGVDPQGDRALASVIKDFGRDITIFARSDRPDQFDGKSVDIPSRRIIGDADVAVAAWDSNLFYYATGAPGTVTVDGKTYPTTGVALAGTTPRRKSKYSPDFAVDPTTLRTIGIDNMLDGNFAPGLLTGRTVFISNVNPEAVKLGYFGQGRLAPYALDIAGAQGARRPFSVDFKWSLELLVFTLLAHSALSTRRRSVKIGWYVLAILSVTVMPAVFNVLGIITLTGPGLAECAFFGAAKLWQRWRRRLQHTSASGLPNLRALTEQRLDAGRDIVVATVGRYEEFLTTLPAPLHGECAIQIARRLSVGSGCAQIFHDDAGHFAWSDEARPLDTQLNHLEGLRALFSAPLQVGDHTFDTNVHFGLDRNEGLDAMTRVNSALASANEALKHGRSVEHFEAKRLAEAPWELSLHARIDEGLRNGDIWLAYQPQWDYRDNRIYGAEALIRWNHPTRGPIQPDAFILQAERAGRIDTLTYWVLENAITSAEELNSLGLRFQMSINLSAQMVDKPSLVSSISEIVRRRGIDCRLLTIEVTETSSVHNRPAARQNLALLRTMGFRLSIDDFGTGEASLSYLAELPSDELKLDRRFVSAITTSLRNRQIVSSTIGLAHALGQTVVAEGIEDNDTFEMLRSMGCDFGQGYFLGRPQTFAQFRSHYLDLAQGDQLTNLATFKDC